MHLLFSRMMRITSSSCRSMLITTRQIRIGSPVSLIFPHNYFLSRLHRWQTETQRRVCSTENVRSHRGRQQCHGSYSSISELLLCRIELQPPDKIWPQYSQQITYGIYWEANSQRQAPRRHGRAPEGGSRHRSPRKIICLQLLEDQEKIPQNLRITPHLCFAAQEGLWGQQLLWLP